MKPARLLLLPCLLTLASCGTNTSRNSIGQLRDVTVDLTDVKIDAGTDKAMRSYQRFLEQTPETAMTPEALRRLADLKVQREYGTVEGVSRNERALDAAETQRIEAMASGSPGSPGEMSATSALPAPLLAAPIIVAAGKTERETKADPTQKGRAQDPGKTSASSARESNQAFEDRATRTAAVPAAAAPALMAPPGENAELQGDAGEAVKLYRKLLTKYPHYERNDQVLYQLARAYEELGMVDEAMKVMRQIPRDYPKSRYYDEVQFRIGEYNFTRKKFLDAEDAYKAVVDLGPGSAFHELSLYKLGWAYYKQEMHEDALHRFVALLDHKIKTGYDFESPKDPLEKKRVEDTYYVISLAFSNLGGPDAVVGYFNKYGKRRYEADVYGNLGEHYLEKRRYNDAAVSYKSFVRQNPYHKVAPHYDTRVIEIYKKGAFPRLVIDANKEFVVNYGLKSAYWQHFDIQAYPEVVGYVKTSLKELSSHYHAQYQQKKLEKDKPGNFQEAMRWYREFLASFPKEAESSAMHFQLASLLLENKDLALAAVEFGRTSYDYPAHEKSAEAGYNAVYAHRAHLGQAQGGARESALQDTIRSSLKFAETYPRHDKAALVMSAALEDVYGMKNYAQAVTTSRRLLALFPTAEPAIRRSAWLTLAHASFELENYPDAEDGYVGALAMMPENDKSRRDVVENLAAAIYKQGELAGKRADYRTAATHFLRVATAAPGSSIRPTADYDGAGALMQVKDWAQAAGVLRAFRSTHTGHQLQSEVTKKLAHIYREDGKPVLAATEYERIETETRDPDLRRAALQMAGELYLEAKEDDKMLVVLRRYLGYFPKPLDVALETRFRIAGVLKARNEYAAYQEELQRIVSADTGGGRERTDRTRYLAASSLLILTEPVYERYAQIRLSKPFEDNLKKKRAALKAVKDAMETILGYEVGETSAAATYYLAEMYFNFGRSLMESERPDDLNAAEKEQYELALEEQAFPFEERAIDVHKKNSDFVTLGIWNGWVEKSYARLATLVPAKYAKFEESGGFIASFDRVAAYGKLTEPMPGIVEPPSVAPNALPTTAAPARNASATPVNPPAAPAQSSGKPPTPATRAEAGSLAQAGTAPLRR